MYITLDKTTASVQIPDSYLLTDEQTAIVQENYPHFDIEAVDGAVDIVPTDLPPPDLTALRAAKITDLSAACNATIVAGSDVQLSAGVEHFTYALEDQINIAEMFTALTLGATSYPYQATDGSCRIYQAEDIIAIYTTLAALKTATLTYYHALKDYVGALEDADTVQAVTWGQPLEGDHLAHYNATITAAQEQMQTILARFGGGPDATLG